MSVFQVFDGGEGDKSFTIHHSGTLNGFRNREYLNKRKYQLSSITEEVKPLMFPPPAGQKVTEVITVFPL